MSSLPSQASVVILLFYHKMFESVAAMSAPISGQAVLNAPFESKGAYLDDACNALHSCGRLRPSLENVRAYWLCGCPRHLEPA